MPGIFACPVCGAECDGRVHLMCPGCDVDLRGLIETMGGDLGNTSDAGGGLEDTFDVRVPPEFRFLRVAVVMFRVFALLIVVIWFVARIIAIRTNPPVWEMIVSTIEMCIQAFLLWVVGDIIRLILTIRQRQTNASPEELADI